MPVAGWGDQRMRGEVGKTILIFLLALPALSLAFDTFGGAAAYLSGGAGARPLGMGGAYVSAAEDVTAIYWNPACLTRLSHYSTEIAAMYSYLGPDLGYNYLGISQHFESWGDFGLSVVHSGVAGAEGWDENGAATGGFSSQSFCGTLAYAAPMNYQFRLGLALKGLSQILADDQAAGYSLDLGAYVMPNLGSYLSLGANLQNAFSALIWDTGFQDKVAPLLKLGASNRYFDWHLLLQVDLDLPLGVAGAIAPHLGAEYWFDNSWAARLGYNRDAPTAGATWQIDFYEFDYAYTLDPGGLGDQHQVAMLLKF
jgi:hypothetical protein